MNRRTKPKTPTFDAVLAEVAKMPGSLRTRSEALGLALDKLHRWERGERTQAMVELDQMAKALGLTITVHKEPQD